MSALQRFFIRVLPSAWTRSMEAESRQWIARCECGHGQSVWDMGGIRWKARGTPGCWMRCPACGKTGWRAIRKET
ncbi:MAG: hypothetical protein JNM65_15945 [Verrucomicrobiaceae bacterium]|nr:hypothetical protein [Verrucomicrobiaceae bacterium]